MYRLILIDPRRGRNAIRTFRTRWQAVQYFNEVIGRPSPAGLGMRLEFHGSKGIVCQHCYDAPIGSPDNWIGRALEIPFPPGGRPAAVDPKKSRSFSLSDADFDIACKIGDGNASAGVSKALRIAVLSRTTFDIN